MTPTLRALLLGLALSTSALGCRGMEPPYPPDHPPEVADLMTAAQTPLRSIQVPRAKVRQGGGPAANLMLVAQAPNRFSGTIQVAGNELVTLAVSEEAYGLRWVGGREGASLAPGYYAGPPSRCAVETLLGVDLEPEAFVDLVLGGAPLIDEPRQITGRGWERKLGRERLTLVNDRYEQVLYFAWVKGQWHFAGAGLSAIEADGSRRWLWTIRHEALHEVDGVVVPEKTEIEQPKANGRGTHTIHVTYLKQTINPNLGGELSADPPKEITDGPINAGDQWDEGDDWEGGDDDGGWEEADGSGPADGGNDGAEAKPPPKPSIPPQFVGNPTGLTPRGDLCAGRR